MSEQTVTRADLSEAVYQEVGLSRNESAELVESVLNEIADSLVAGDTVSDVLEYVEFQPSELITVFRRKVARAKGLTRSERNRFIAEYVEGLEGYTYLEELSNTPPAEEAAGPGHADDADSARA